MQNKKIIMWGLGAAASEVAYVALVALLMINSQKLFGNSSGALGLVAFLMLFVISAAISGALIIGKPVLLYLEGKKRQAVELFAYTIGWLVLFLIITLSVLGLY